MIAALIIVFREVFEAGLVVGIVLAVTQGVPRRAVWISAAGEAVVSGSKSVAALAVVVCVAVLRAGFEVVMFLYGVLATEGATGLEVLTGGVAGMLLGALVCAATYFGMLTIPQRYLFGVTSFMIAFLAAGMAAQAIGFLEQANVVLALDRVAWDSSWLLSDSSILGRVLRTLIGYNDRPTVMQLTVYCATLAVMFSLMKLLAPPPRGRHPVTA